MKREKARLEALHAMPYEEYLQTSEWREVEKAALKRADNRCQVCRAAGVALRVHHVAYDNLGCEQEADVMVLCEGCHDTLAQKMQQAIQKTVGQAEDQEQEKPSVPAASLGQRALVFAPTALGLDALMFLMHAPPPAEIGGLVAAFLLAAKFPQIYASMRTSLPEPLRILVDAQAERRRARATRGEWSAWDKLLGVQFALIVASIGVELPRDPAWRYWGAWLVVGGLIFVNACGDWNSSSGYGPWGQCGFCLVVFFITFCMLLFAIMALKHAWTMMKHKSGSNT